MLQEKEVQAVGLVGAVNNWVAGCIILVQSREPD